MAGDIVSIDPANPGGAGHYSHADAAGGFVFMS
jgi:hypothetical protein